MSAALYPPAHESAHLHVSGEAVYVDDIPELRGTLHAALGLSTHAHARIKSIDYAPVRAMPGVVSVITARDIPGKNDWLFFILSTRMLPPIVVAIPMYLMYRVVGLNDTHIGLIILYTAFNLSFSVWLMKGFMDEIPKEYEEAALVDGYTRLQSFFKIVLPEAVTGIAATSVFCFITAWNEYAFALIMTSRRAQTAPPFIPSQVGSGLIDWTVIAAGTLLFILPVAIFTFMLRNHLLRGVTFGAIRK